MGKKSQPTPPPPPDPREIAQTDAEFNRIDQYTPGGSLTYSGPSRNVATIKLGEAEQGLYDSQVQTDQNLLSEALRRFGSLDSNPIDLSQFGPIQTGIDQSNISFDQFNPTGLQQVNGPNLSGVGTGPNLQQSIGTFGVPNSPDLQQNIGQTLGIQSGVDPMQVQRQLDTSGVNKLPTDLEAYRGDVQQAFFDRSRSLLDPYFADQQNQLTNTLNNRGLPESGAAYDTANTRFLDRQNKAYGDAANQSVIEAGNQASRQLGDILANQGQQFGQSLAGGQFANNATGQQFGQNLAAGNFANSAAGQDFGQAQARGNFANQASQQGFQNNLAGAQFGLGQNLAAGDFANNASQQQYQNQLAGTGFNNATGLSQFGADAGLRDQQFNEQANTANFNNQASAQNLALQQQLLANNNAGRTQGLAEQTNVRNNQYNELASLLGLQQVQQPGMSDFFGPGQANVTDAYALNQQGQQNNYNNQMSQNNSMLSGLFGLGGSFLGGPLGGAAGSALGGLLGGGDKNYSPYSASDIRLKKNLKMIEQKNGVNWYTWDWNDTANELGISDPTFGVIAQELKKTHPDAVQTGEHGYLTVDYRMI